MWKAAGVALSIRDCAALLIAYHALPDTDQVYPRAENVLKVSKRVLDHYPADESVQLMEKIVDILCKRVISRIRSARNIGDLIKLQMPSVLHKSLMMLMMREGTSSSDMERVQKLLYESIKIKKYYEDLGAKSHADAQCGDDSLSEGSEVEVPWLGWMRAPTMKWLQSGGWVHALPLRNVYSTSDEYAETLLRMWVLLTFYWGGGAVWPKCRQQHGTGTEAKACMEPLLTPQQSSAVFCRSQGCNNPARWRCHKQKHDAVCQECLRRHQVRLCGGPGVDASTDIYDGLIDRENLIDAGTVYSISQVKSRKPPKIVPNWRTAYRLNCSVLVGIVKLAHEGEPLTSDKRIMWAEVVPMDPKVGTTDEWRNRTHGKMAIRVLTRSDCDGFPEEADAPLDLGMRVAVVDMRVFVPEVISILGTFAKDTFPEELGSLPFINSLIGKHENRHSRFLQEIKSTATLRHQIMHAVTFSNVKWVSGLSDELKLNLANEICQIPSVKTLSGTQLEAFSSALFSDVHCTQGPPGTGKVSCD